MNLGFKGGHYFFFKKMQLQKIPFQEFPLHKNPFQKKLNILKVSEKSILNRLGNRTHDLIKEITDIQSNV